MSITVPQHANEELNRQFLSAVAAADRAQRHCREAIAAAREAQDAADLAQAAAHRAENVLEAMQTLMILLRRAEGNLAEPEADFQSEEEEDDDDDDHDEARDGAEVQTDARNVRQRRQ